jgi:DNA polymerase III alpha subunit
MKTHDILKIRQTLFENVEYLLDKVNSYKEEGKNNSMDLFSDDDQLDETLELKASTTINQLNVLLKEKEFLGLYVTNNPITEFTPVLKVVRNISEKENIHLILIDKIKKIFTRNKEMMFALEISIDGEKVEGIIFPKYALNLSPILEEKKLFFALGRISLPKKKKQEVAVLEEGEFESEDGNQVQEFVELPKLMIDSLSPFEEGCKKLFVKDEDKISKARQELLDKIDFVSILADPDSYKNYLNNSEPETTETTGTNFKRLELPKTLDKQKAIQIKKLLTTNGTQDVVIQLYVELPTGEFKKAKQDYPVSQMVYDQILENLK